jgi:hypothetical protein
VAESAGGGVTVGPSDLGGAAVILDLEAVEPGADVLGEP